MVHDILNLSGRLWSLCEVWWKVKWISIVPFFLIFSSAGLHDCCVTCQQITHCSSYTLYPALIHPNALKLLNNTTIHPMYIHWCTTLYILLYYTIYISILHYTYCCTTLYTVLLHTIHTAVPQYTTNCAPNCTTLYIQLYHTIHPTVLPYYIIYLTVLHYTHCCYTLYTLVCYIIYLTVLHYTNCCTTLYTQLYYTKQTAVLHYTHYCNTLYYCSTLYTLLYYNTYNAEVHYRHKCSTLFTL